jgi:hypothetical protein
LRWWAALPCRLEQAIAGHEPALIESGSSGFGVVQRSAEQVLAANGNLTEGSSSYDSSVFPSSAMSFISTPGSGSPT